MILINFLIPIVPAEEIIPKASDRTTAGNNSDKNTQTKAQTKQIKNLVSDAKTIYIIEIAQTTPQSSGGFKNI